jgi:subtilase family serine protease
MNIYECLSVRSAASRVLKASVIAALIPCALTFALGQDAVRGFQPEAVIITPSGPTPAAVRPHFMPGEAVVPASSQVNAADTGKRAHTNVRYIVPVFNTPDEAPPYTGYAYETPASLACIYGVTTAVAGCNPNATVNTPSGGTQTIVIVDAYDDPDAQSDLAYFSAQFGLPFNPSKFNVVYQGGYQPMQDFSGGWELEESLDIEYAHAMAPQANLFLVEAQSNQDSDLFTSVQIGINLIHCGKVTTCPAATTTAPWGKGEISMSWGESEFSAETSYDPCFSGAAACGPAGASAALPTTGIVFFASAGDAPGTIYPCVSPNVVCAGGTSTRRNLVTGNLLQEIAWSDAGGGVSTYEPIPSYQTAVAAVKAIVGTHRGTPDLSAVANPYTGVWVYDSFPQYGAYFASSWWIVGGTSVSSPLLAGIVNNAGSFSASSSAELSLIYTNLGVAANFSDITYGACNYYMGSAAVTGYDLCTGVGSPKGKAGK